MDGKKKKVELLAPAGNFDALKGALRAGADAIYLGGRLFGARAYAENFSDEEICAGIRLAHLWGKKIYLTVNTLVKEKELDGLFAFLLPFYECGLDGVIVQDLGALSLIGKCFPGLELHASTQMTITGSEGARFLKEHGVVRVVPARELSLLELQKMKEETGLELEVFIHGAMCYCYSGQCLFSSLLGGRSGNRGRCAQPCRLPYQTGSLKNGYPLSMKDMCTIDLLPELIEAGIDSFKIEGRMKKAAYAAGVTAIYRKYLDLYYEGKETYRVSDKDRKRLEALYIRSEIGDGYYHRTNGREMITLDSPAYRETREELLGEIEETYIRQPLTKKVEAKICLQVGAPAKLTLMDGKTEITGYGAVVEQSMKQPLSEDKIREQIQKSGNTLLDIETVRVEADAEIFLPIRSLNELRREAVSAMENRLIEQAGFATCREDAVPGMDAEPSEQKQSARKPFKRHLHLTVLTLPQLEAALEAGADRIYVENGLAESAREAFGKEILSSCYLTTPYVVRDKDRQHLEHLAELVEEGAFRGILVRNLESLSILLQKQIKHLVLDANLYVWNRESGDFFAPFVEEFFLPIEENLYEWKELLGQNREWTSKASVLAYGRLPMMVTANCVKKTTGGCRKEPGMTKLVDRYQKHFPVYTDCRNCYNIIYNSVPLSLHRMAAEDKLPVQNLRLDFTVEDQSETQKVIRYFQDLSEGYRDPFYKEYTTGHYKRGVE